MVPEDERHEAFACDVLLDFTECRTDILVFAPDLQWTIAFTHEQPNLGPYFSRARVVHRRPVRAGLTGCTLTLPDASLFR